MNRGTKIRVALYIVALLNQANVTIGVWEFGNETVNTVYKIFSYLLTLGATAVTLWFNQDFTEEACIGTGITRQLKQEKKDGYVGDYFYRSDTELVDDELVADEEVGDGDE